MGRILAIDYGLKRCGLAVTDPLKIIANPLATVENSALWTFLKDYLTKEDVEGIILGMPRDNNMERPSFAKEIELLANRIKQSFPNLKIDFQNEYNTSNEARNIILKSGLRKKRRRDKSLVDTVSAVLILQRYLNHI